MLTAADPTPPLVPAISEAPSDPPTFYLTDTDSFWSVNVGDLISLLVGLIAGGALYFTWRQVRHAQRAARDAAQPYVWADFRLDETQGSFLRLILRNEGPTVARNVRAVFDPPLQTPPNVDSGPLHELLTAGLRSMPPGREMRWGVGTGTIFKSGVPLRYTVTISFDGPHGPVAEQPYVLDLSEIEHMLAPRTGTLTDVAAAIKTLGEARSPTPRIPPPGF